MINYTPPTNHTSLFYRNHEEYLDVIIPFLKAGLENNEFCFWILPHTLKLKNAKIHLRRSIEDLDDYFAKGQLMIGDYKEFYLKDEFFSWRQSIENITDMVKNALEKGFKRIRITGDGSWAVDSGHWFNFLRYEKEVNKALESYKIKAICSYSIAKLDLRNLCEIGITHQLSLANLAGNWNRIETDQLAGIRRVLSY